MRSLPQIAGETVADYIRRLDRWFGTRGGADREEAIERAVERSKVGDGGQGMLDTDPTPGSLRYNNPNYPEAVRRSRGLLDEDPNYDYANILPIKQDPEGRVSMAWPTVAREAWGGLNDLVATGGIDPHGNINPEAMLSMLGVTGLGGTPKGALASLGGRSARTADLQKLKLAEHMEGANNTLRNAGGQSLGEGQLTGDIWQATGWERGSEGKWRFEIGDQDARVIPKAFGPAPVGPDPRTFAGNMDQVFKHDALYEAYPWLRNTRISLTIDPTKKVGGHYNPGIGDIVLTAPNAREAKKAILHETAHAVQQAEGFARGGSGRMEGDNLMRAGLERDDPHIIRSLNAVAMSAYEKPFNQLTNTQKMDVTEALSVNLGNDQYARLGGEVEARNVEYREGMDPEVRSQIPFVRTEDTPRGNQNILRSAEQSTHFNPGPRENWPDDVRPPGAQVWDNNFLAAGGRGARRGATAGMLAPDRQGQMVY